MRLILLSLLLFIGLNAFGQNITNHEVEPKGVYREINLSNDIKVIQRLFDTTSHSPNGALVDSIKQNANTFTPPVLYVLSNVLFSQAKYNEACFWFYVAQLRARYDVNRCTDKTANADSYNQNFGPTINEYAFKHIDSLKVIVQKVVNYVRVNEEIYDQRWINLTGMDVFKASMSDKPVDEKLSIDKSKWPAVKKKTIDDYYADFEEATNRDIIVDKESLLGKDYRLFQNTAAWELAKAVEDGDTAKIRAEVRKNKSLLNFKEPHFGNSLLLMAVINSNYASTKALVELGADPNIQDNEGGNTPLISAADIGMGEAVPADPRFLKILLKYGGDPNTEMPNYGDSPLRKACEQNNLDYVKILVDAGANVNAVSKHGGSPLAYACDGVQLRGNPEVVIYLIEKGADYKKPLYTTINGEKKYITDALRGWRFDLESNEYKKKMQLVDLLKKNGMDYWKTKVPGEFLNDYPKEYLEKY